MKPNKEAKFWEKEKDVIRCKLCPHNCKLKNEMVGICRVRKNIDGTLYALNYGKVSAIALDPIEKKPLFNFYPGSKILSVGTFGCNLKCSFCQNWQIAHDNPNTIEVESELLVKKALDSGSIGIAFTYNEPTIWYEYVYDTSVLAKKEGLKNVLVSNGFIAEEPLKELLPYIDAMNIDVKSFAESYYNKICKGSLDQVKRTVEIASGKCHVEITTLVLPDLNDSIEEIQDLSKWIGSIDKKISLHLSRYFPNYNMNMLPTPKSTLYKLKDVAEKYLDNVYLGNMF